MPGRNYYQVLGLPFDAASEAIIKAYRELAKKYHPDLNPDDASAAERMKEVNAAYEILGNFERRQIYDLAIGVAEVFANAVRSEETKPRAGVTADRDVLVALYEATDGPNWSQNDNWLTDAPLGDWYGVDTDHNGRVTSLDLSSNELSGAIPPELSNLVDLRGLFLSSNQLSGEIPPELGSLVDLGLLHLSDNRLSGEIPTELGNLTDLSGLHLSRNRLSGKIPPELGNLVDLSGLGLASNHLSGGIPLELGDLAGLRVLLLNSNRLSGEIPPELGNLANLGYLQLSENRLSGEIPLSLGNLANLRGLFLSGNQFSGCVSKRLRNVFKNDLDELDLPTCPNRAKVWLRSFLPFL